MRKVRVADIRPGVQAFDPRKRRWVRVHQILDRDEYLGMVRFLCEDSGRPVELTADLDDTWVVR